MCMKGAYDVTFKDLKIPVAVSAWGLRGGKVLIGGEDGEGKVGKAVRASAAFPGLISPVIWGKEDEGGVKEDGGWGDFIQPLVDFWYGEVDLLWDGGIGDPHGTRGLKLLWEGKKGRKR